MRVKLRIVAVVVIVLIVGGLAIHRALNNEPRYQGRTLTEWMKLHEDAATVGTKISNPEAVRLQCEQAVRAMGTNAIPFLLGQLGAHDSKFKAGLFRIWEDLFSKPVQYRDAEEKHYFARQGFILIQQDALPAVPALIQLTRDTDPNVRTMAHCILMHANPGKATLLPVQIEGLKDTNRYVRSAVASYLEETYPEEAEAAGVYVMFPGMRAPATNSPVVK